MKKTAKNGVYQLENGNWGYRYGVVVDGKTIWRKKVRDQDGNVMKSKTAAVRAREASMAEVLKGESQPKKKSRKTVAQVYKEYCETGRHGKAYATVRKQDSLWNNHICCRFGTRYVDDIAVAEVNDYLAELYYVEGRAYKYVESFLKMFYLIFGQAYSRDYLDADSYNKLCKDKEVRIRMPKMKVDEETDIQVFSNGELVQLDSYFKGTNAETAYLIGRYCGLRINECYGLKWENVDLDEGVIIIDRQMQYQNGLIKLVPLKTRNAKRVVYMNERLKEHLLVIKEEQDVSDENIRAIRKQNQTYIEDLAGKRISCLDLVNCLPNGKIQTVNSMKFHSRKIQATLGIKFKYHYLRHTFGTHLANLNTPAHILRRQMGHGNVNVTMQYYLAMSEDGIELLKDNLSKM